MPATSASSPVTAGPGPTRAALEQLRPELVGRYDAELAGARAAVLSRLLGAVDREPLPGLTGRPAAGQAIFQSALEPGTPGAAGTHDHAAIAPHYGTAATTLGHAAPVPHYATAATGPDHTAPPTTGVTSTTVPGHATPATTMTGHATPGTVVPSHAASADRLGDARERILRYPAAAARPFAEDQPGLTVTLGDVVTDDPGTLVRLLWGDVPFAAEVDNSVANMALARANRAVTSTGSLAELEQSVVDGHPLHPGARTRGGMSVADVLAYAPEHRPVIRLRKLRVPEKRWYGTAPPILYAHPWQAARLRDEFPWLTDAGETGPARPLMSLRTVAPLDGGPHVKTAVDVQMTSAVRTVSPAAVHNGPIVSALLRGITADLPIDVLAETRAGAVIVDGAPQRRLGYLMRVSPLMSVGEIAAPLATVPLLLSRLRTAYEFFGLLGEVVFGPLVRVLARGIALEAHGQNTLLVLRDGRPVRMIYRDFGGVRVSPARLRERDLVLHGDLISDDPDVLREKLAAAAFGSVAAELVAAFAARGADPERLWRIIAEAVRGTGEPDAVRLLTGPLPVKATTAMRLAADPLDDVWAHTGNPMAAYA